MKTEWLKNEIHAITYNDETDVVALRYLILQALALYVVEYKSVAGTGYAFQLLQQHRKLEAAHAALKQKCRSCTAGILDFSQTKSIALEHITQLISHKTSVIAA